MYTHIYSYICFYSYKDHSIIILDTGALFFLKLFKLCASLTTRKSLKGWKSEK